METLSYEQEQQIFEKVAKERNLSVDLVAKEWSKAYTGIQWKRPDGFPNTTEKMENALNWWLDQQKISEPAKQ